MEIHLRRVKRESSDTSLTEARWRMYVRISLYMCIYIYICNLYRFIVVAQAAAGRNNFDEALELHMPACQLSVI